MSDLSWVGAGVVVLAIGCASSAPPPTTEKTVPGAQSLLGSEWELRDLGGTPVLPDRRPTLNFVDPGRISGSASCNRYGGGADLGDGTIKVGPLQTTRMACTPEIDAQERAYLVALQNSHRLEIVAASWSCTARAWRSPSSSAASGERRRDVRPGGRALPSPGAEARAISRR
jgi:heat shock protein HslJ